MLQLRRPAAAPAPYDPVIETALVRRSVGALSAGRICCRHCRRTPLVGELVHVFAAGEIVCELCLPLRAGRPERSALVRSPEHARMVRLRPRPA